MGGSLDFPPGRPDAVDAVRVLALGLVAFAGISALPLAGLWRETASALQQGLFLAIPLVYARVAKLPPGASCGFARIGVRPLVLVLVASLGSLWVLKGVSELQEPVYRWLGLGREIKAEQEAIKRGLEQAKRESLALAFARFGLFAPLCEETLFRGIVLRGFAARFGAKAAVLGTAALFAALHQTVVQAALMFFLGIYFGAVVWLTGSVWAGVIAHAVNNLTVLVLTHHYGQRLNDLQAPLWVVALSAAVFGMALALLALDRNVTAGREGT